jgi:hypothetical protein
MSNNLKKIFGSIVSIFVLLPILTLAQQTVDAPYTLLQGDLPGINTSTTLSTYIPAAFNLIIAIGAALAFVVITYGGIMYATTDALSNKQEGRKHIENAIYGLILLIGSYAILNTINPDLVNLRLDVRRPSVYVAPTAPVATGTVASNCPSPCDALGAGGLNLPLGPGVSRNASINTVFGQRLVNLSERLSQIGIPWQITEGFPPTATHRDSCHNVNATCVDAKPLDQTPRNLQLFRQTAQSAGLNAVYEVKTLDESNVIKYGCGRPPCPSTNGAIGNVPWVTVNPNATGPHFHIE